jgi:branched-subunit amino acid permease
METFQGYFKDGTNGTYDWRFLAGVYPLLRIIIMLSFLHSYHRDNTNNYSVMGCIVVSGIFSLVRPYKKLIHNRVNIVLLSLITFMMWYVTDFWPISLHQYKLLDHVGNIIILVLLVLVPHLIFASVVIHKALQLLLYRCGNGQPTTCCVSTCLTVLRSRAISGENEDELALALDAGN